jgi:uncharacterized membrane protein YfcA
MGEQAMNNPLTTETTLACSRLFGRSPAKSTWGGLIADGTIGFGGGVLGGLAGLSGPLPTMWATIRGWGKRESRGVFHAFNLTVLSIALLSHAFAGLLTAEVGWALLAALPGTTTGAWLGAHAYGRVDNRRFRVIITSAAIRVRRCTDLEERITAPLRLIKCSINLSNRSPSR